MIRLYMEHRATLRQIAEDIVFVHYLLDFLLLTFIQSSIDPDVFMYSITPNVCLILLFKELDEELDPVRKDMSMSLRIAGPQKSTILGYFPDIVSESSIHS